MKVWILTTGVLHEGSTIEGVFTTRELGHGAFANHAEQLYKRLGFTEATVLEDDGLYVEGGDDFVELRPYDVTGRFEITGK